MMCHEDTLANFPTSSIQVSISYYDIVVFMFSNQPSNMERPEATFHMLSNTSFLNTKLANLTPPTEFSSSFIACLCDSNGSTY